MSRPASRSHALALKAAAAIAAQDDEAEVDAPAPVTEPIESEPEQAIEAPAPSSKRGRGRPKGKRPVEARQSVYLDAARHDALVRIAEDRGRSVHSLILEGIDLVIGKPQRAGWMG